MAIFNTLFDPIFSDVLTDRRTVSVPVASGIFHYFQNHPLFRWRDANNDCEDRANAVCMLLDKWKVPNCKVWVFGGAFLRRDGGYLINCWGYHVAAALPVMEDQYLQFYVLDPATLTDITVLAEWAGRITDTSFSHYLIKESQAYIFNPTSLAATAWHPRDRQNYKWTIQGLAGVNGVSQAGKARLVFNKRLIAETEIKFQQLLHSPSPF